MVHIWLWELLLRGKIRWWSIKLLWSLVIGSILFNFKPPVWVFVGDLHNDVICLFLASSYSYESIAKFVEVPLRIALFNSR